jgi:hypothetical protein
MSALDKQVGGSHYKNMAIQPLEYCMANEMDSCQSHIIKYVSRFREKGGIGDLEKAKHFIELLIEFEGKKQEAAKTLMAEVPSNVYPLGTTETRNTDQIKDAPWAGVDRFVAAA